MKAQVQRINLLDATNAHRTTIFLRRMMAFAVSSLRVALRTISYCYQENSALVLRVGTEESDYIIVEKSETRCTQSLRVCSQVQFAAKNTRFQLHRTISTIAKSLQNRPQVRQKEYVDGSVSRQL